ncbi:MAG: carboxypeptidase regulatory-like domain-containing protein [Nitrospira sp.]|nr:carboxypeptidase regulatory-like domain-containing protein [Nitrospira sp.]
MKGKVCCLGLVCALAVLGSVSVAGAYDVREVEGGGTISGRVSFEGTVPPSKQFQVKKDQEVCGTERSVHEVSVSDGWLKGAVVVLEGVTSGKQFVSAHSRGEEPGEGVFHYGEGTHLSLEILTKGCNFGPFTGVLAADEPVRFLNHDRVKHILHTVSSKDDKGLILRTVHNREIRPDTVVEETFTAGVLKMSHVVGVHCNRHDFMQSWLYVVTSPYYAISDREGGFTIDQVPPGQYELIAWHPALGLKRQTVTVSQGDRAEVTFAFSGK